MEIDFSQPYRPQSHDAANTSKSAILERGLPWLYDVVFPVLLGGCLYFYEKETLFRIQELNLFLPGKQFYQSLAAYPGGTLQWAACFFTQFFYYPAAGAAWLVVFWILSCLLLRSAFRLSGARGALTLLLPSALLAGIVQMGYFIYYIQLQGYYFTASLGILTALAAVWVFSRLNNRKSYAGTVWLAVWPAVGYPLFGAYALAASIYMIALCWRMPETNRKFRVANTIAGTLLVVGVPLLTCQFGYTQTSIHAVYTAALPCFNSAGEIFTRYRIPYYILLATPLIAAVTHGLHITTKRGITIALHLILWAAVGIGLKKTWYVDGNFRSELRMTRAIENEDWEKVPEIFWETNGEPTRLMVMQKNLALFRLGRAGDEMFRYREGDARPNAPFRVRLTQVGGKALYYHYGQENYCYRWCMEDGVTYGWKTEYLKYMAKTSIVNGDHRVARKYLGMLARTLFHKEWAEKYSRYLDHPEAVRESREFAPILSLMPEKDELASDQSVIETYLLRSFAHGNSDNVLHQEQNLIAALQMKDIGLFWPRFFKYAALHPNGHMPRHYQEAAYLYGHLEQQVDISRMPFDAEVKESYRRFMAFTQQCAGMTEAQMAEAFRPEFGQTFYYFYFLVNGQQTY